MRICKIIMSALLLLCTSLAFAQQNNWDEVLDRYELLCERCLELKKQQQVGVEVPRESLMSLATQLSSLKRTLKEAKGKMSAAQQARFDMIRKQFGSTGTAQSTPMEEKVSKTSAKAVAKPCQITELELPVRVPYTPKIHAIPMLSDTSGVLAFSAKGLSSSGIIAAKAITEHQYAGQSRPKFFVSAQASIFPALSYGLAAGSVWKHWGVYAKGRYDMCFSIPAPSYNCNSRGAIENGGKFVQGGKEAQRRIVGTAGIIHRFGKIPGIYCGIGYGMYSYMAQDAEGKWARVSDLSTQGAAFDIGVCLFTDRYFTASAGICTTGLRYSELEMSVGIVF
ncbi:MAG: hypothetical protein MJY91_08855 [Bacteroidales bacterium]|nr:hypothetical protein [Bacteroidales bacterium]